jgi:hypothetical protein
MKLVLAIGLVGTLPFVLCLLVLMLCVELVKFLLSVLKESKEVFQRLDYSGDRRYIKKDMIEYHKRLRA